MKRRLLLFVAIASLAGGSASAETVCTDLACVGVNEGGYLIVVDGHAANPDPLDGFISVSGDLQLCADDNGTADDGNPDNGPESTSPTCAP